ncbi:MAG: transcription elongation factor GreB [Bdellovibrionota bacterium]
MSKAFTKENSDQENEEPENTASPLPKGAPNYITPGGLRALEKELDELTRIERPKVVETVAWAASLGDRSENADYIYGKKRLKEIDRRIRFLSKKLDNAEVVDPEKREPVPQVFLELPFSFKTKRNSNAPTTLWVSTRPTPIGAR